VNRVRAPEIEAPVFLLNLRYDSGHERISLARSMDGTHEVAIRFGALDDNAQFEVPVDGSVASKPGGRGYLIG
jgi:hypothetical protein